MYSSIVNIFNLYNIIIFALKNRSDQFDIFKFFIEQKQIFNNKAAM